MANKVKGFYGGKFIPLHKGHEYCIEKACQMCDVVYVILFDAPENRHLEKGTDIDKYLTIKARMTQLESIKTKLEEKYPNVKINIVYVNTDCCVDENGNEDWDAETPLVIKACEGTFNYVYSSEPSYGEYFSRAYPWAAHILVDPPRITYPISGTKCRTLQETELQEWLAK